MNMSTTTMFLVQSDADPTKFFCEDRWVYREAARRFSLSEATKVAMKTTKMVTTTNMTKFALKERIADE